MSELDIEFGLLILANEMAIALTDELLSPTAMELALRNCDDAILAYAYRTGE